MYSLQFLKLSNTLVRSRCHSLIKPGWPPSFNLAPATVLWVLLHPLRKEFGIISMGICCSQAQLGSSLHLSHATGLCFVHCQPYGLYLFSSRTTETCTFAPTTICFFKPWLFGFASFHITSQLLAPSFTTFISNRQIFSVVLRYT